MKCEVTVMSSRANRIGTRDSFLRGVETAARNFGNLLNSDNEAQKEKRST